MKPYKWIILACIAVFLIVGFSEYFMGRLPLGPDGRFGWWESSIYSSENSQRFADAYSFTHVIHGFGFYLLIWLLAKKLPVKYRFLAAVILEGAWEVFENSSFIINRYRETTVSLGYVGDSILNSLSDILMMMAGFWVAWKAKIWQSILAIVAIELTLLYLVRDNLILNLIMLIYPIEAIKNWQSAGEALLKIK